MAKKKRQPETLSEQLRAIILQAPVTRYRIAKDAHVDHGQLHRFVTTGKGISIETLDRIGAVLRLRLVVDTDPNE